MRVCILQSVPGVINGIETVFAFLGLSTISKLAGCNCIASRMYEALMSVDDAPRETLRVS